MSVSLPSFVRACMTYFEIPTSSAVTEIKALSDTDRQELSEMLQPIIPHTPPQPRTA